MSEKEFKEFINNPKNVRDYPSATVRAAIKSEELGVNERSDRNGYLISRFSPVIHTPKDEITSKTYRGNQENTELCDEITLRAIKTRRGQPAFRQALLTEYKGTCCITGCKIEAVLEAAHITPHGDETNYSVFNGLLLRADVHTLFDLGLLRINEAGIVMVDSSLNDSEYFQYDGNYIVDRELTLQIIDNLRERLERMG
jgi:predicted restriction endonuclease